MFLERDQLVTDTLGRCPRGAQPARQRRAMGATRVRGRCQRDGHLHVHLPGHALVRTPAAERRGRCAVAECYRAKAATSRSPVAVTGRTSMPASSNSSPTLTDHEPVARIGDRRRWPPAEDRNCTKAIVSLGDDPARLGRPPGRRRDRPLWDCADRKSNRRLRAVRAPSVALPPGPKMRAQRHLLVAGNTAQVTCAIASQRQRPFHRLRLMSRFDNRHGLLRLYGAGPSLAGRVHQVHDTATEAAWRSPSVVGLVQPTKECSYASRHQVRRCRVGLSRWGDRGPGCGCGGTFTAAVSRAQS